MITEERLLELGFVASHDNEDKEDYYYANWPYVYIIDYGHVVIEIEDDFSICISNRGTKYSEDSIAPNGVYNEEKLLQLIYLLKGEW
jgi:hypothetical protein